MYLFGSPARTSLSPAATVPSELGTKVGGPSQLGQSSNPALTTLDFGVPGPGWHVVLLGGLCFRLPPCSPQGLPPACPGFSLVPLPTSLGPSLAAVTAFSLLGWGDQAAPSHNSVPSSSPVPYDICRPDHSVLTLQLPVTASVREVMAALAQEDSWTKGQVLVKVNSAGGELCLWVGWPRGRGPPQSYAHPLN